MIPVRTSDPRYLIVFGACLTQFVIIGLLFSYGLFFKAFETEFGWSRTVLSACPSLAFLMMGILAIFVGRLSDRYGPRIVLSVTGTLFGLGFAMIAMVSEPWHLFLIFGVFVGLGMATHDVVTLSTVARWFELRRGLMTGVVKVGTAFGQIALPPVTAVLILQLGWRDGAITLGLAAVLILLLAACSMKNPPIKPENNQTAASSGGEAFGFDLQAVLRMSVFWRLCAIQFLFLPTLTTVPLHIVVHGMDLGMSTTLAATLLSVTGGASIAGRLMVGTLTDRIGGKWAMVFSFLPLLTSLLALLLTTTPWVIFFVVAVYGFGHGGLFTVVAPTIAGYFGTRSHGTVFGAVVFFGTIGGAAGPILAGRIFDITGSYALAFASLAAMVALGLMLALSLPSTTTIARQCNAQRD